MAEFPVPDAVVVPKLGPEQTAGRFELFEVHATRGEAAPPHREPWDKAYYVLHGHLTVHVGGADHELGPGGSVGVPAGVPNTFAVRSPSATFLAFSLTAAMGAFFADLAATVPAGGSLTDVVPQILEVTDRHGVTFAAASLPGGTR